MKRGIEVGALLVFAAACGGSEFSQAADDASPSAGSTVSSGGAGGVGGSGGASSGAAGTSSGGSAGRDAGDDGRGGSAGAPRNSGDCQVAADCGGDPCVELYPGGYRVCSTKVPEATTCSNPPGQCCKSSDCGFDARPSGKCILGPVEPFCGGPVVVSSNVCASDACMAAADCPGANAICAPAGTLGRKAARCLTGGCRFDKDCTAEPGGACVPIAGACCNQPVGLFCLYPGGCRSNADCKANEQCQTDATRAFCAPAGACPATP